MPSLTLAGHNRKLITERYIRSTMPVFWTDLSRHDGNQFISDDATGHLATVTGALWTPQGRTFDGVDDKITIPFHSSFQTATLTVIIWFKGSGVARGRLIQIGDISGAWMMSYKDNTEMFAIYDAGWENWAYTSPYGVNTWYHVALTFDANKLASYYINGVLDNSKTFTKAIPTLDNELTIGQATDVASFGNAWLAATVREVSLYNRALTAAEIQHNYLVTKWRYV